MKKKKPSFFTKGTSYVKKKLAQERKAFAKRRADEREIKSIESKARLAARKREAAIFAKNEAKIRRQDREKRLKAQLNPPKRSSSSSGGFGFASIGDAIGGTSTPVTRTVRKSSGKKRKKSRSRTVRSRRVTNDLPDVGNGIGLNL